MADRRIGFNLDFKANTKDVESNLSKLKKSLQDLQNIKFGDFKGSNDELRQIKRTASQVQGILERSFNTSLNATNIVEFRNQLDKTGLSMKDIQASFAQAGPIGQRAFGQLTSSILTTNLQLRETHSLIDSMGKTMMNTVKWGIASSIMNSFTQSVQGAFSYVQSLQKSLTNIRIVTGDNTQQMAKFADQANRAAQELGRSTLDYTKSSLTFYQQGLDDETVQARTEATLKAQNITGTGAQMADYLTSVWNGYKVANEQAQLYVDKLAAVADSSASDMSQLAIAMSKVSATANILGVDVDQLAAQIATVVATTRQAPESVGTAFKTIYARLNDIKTGSDQAEISLGNYSGKMATLGINVLDATGHLRDTGEVMTEIGQKWATMTREQQIYLAQTMGGQRQITQVTALFDNWATYSELLNISLQSQGTLNEKNARYMESLGAKMEQLGAAGERVKAALIDEDTVKGGVQALTNLTNLTASFIESIGGGNNALLALGSIATQVFSGVISKEISSLITNFQNAKYNAEALNAEIALTKTIRESGQESAGGQYVAKQMAEFQQYYSVLDQASINRQKNLIDERGQIENQIAAIKEARKAISETFGEVPKEDWSIVDTEKLNEINSKIGQLSTRTQTLRTSLSQTFSNKTFDIGEGFDNFTKDFNSFYESYKEIDPSKAESLKNAFKNLGQAGGLTPAEFETQLTRALDNATQKSQEFSNTISNSEENYQRLKNTAKSLDATIIQNTENAKQLFDVTKVIKLTASIGQLATVLNNIANLKRIIKDEDLTAGQKLLQIVTNIGFTLPLILNIYKNVKDLTKQLGLLQAKELAQQKIKNAEKAHQLATEKQITFQKKQQAALDQGADPYALNQIFGKEAQQITKEVNSTSKAVDSAKEEFEKLGSDGSIAISALKDKVVAFLPKLASIAPYAAAAAIAIGLVVAVYKAWNEQADAAQRANKIAADSKKAYDELKTSADELKTSLDNLHTAEENLDNLTKGTQEWKDALQEVNNQVLDLIAKYPELAQYVENTNGRLSLNEQGEAAYLAQVNAGVQNARNASQIAASQSREANATASAAAIGHRVLRTEEEGGGWASADQVMNVAEGLKQAIEDGVEKPDWAKQIAQNTGMSERLVSAILSNEDEINRLNNQLQQNELADKLMYESIAGSALTDNGIYQGLDDLGKQVATALAGQDLSSLVEQKTNQWLDEMTNGVHVFSGAANKQVQHILSELNNAQGTNWKLDANAVRGTDTNRAFAFRDENGDEKILTKEQIAATLATTEALKQLGASAETTANLLKELDSNFTENESNSIKNFLAGNGFQDLTQKEFLDITGNRDNTIEKLNQFYQNNKKSFEQLGYQSAESFIDAYFEGIESDYKKFDIFTSKLNQNLRDMVPKNLSLKATENISNALSVAFQHGGQKGASILNNIMATLQPKDLEVFSNTLGSIDWTQNGAFENFTQSLKEQGIVLEENSEEWAAFEIFLENIGIKSLNATSSIDRLRSSLSSLKQIQNLKSGDILSDEEYQKLIQNNAALKDFFTIAIDGYMFIGNQEDVLKELNNDVDNTIEHFQKLREQGAKIAEDKSLQNNLSNVNLEDRENDNFGQAISLDALREMSRNQNFVSALEQQGLDIQSFNNSIDEIQKVKNYHTKTLNAQQKAAYDDALRIAQEYVSSVSQLSSDYENGLFDDKNLHSLIASSATSLQELRDFVAEQKISLEDYDKFRESFINKEIERLNITRQQYDATYSEISKILAENSESFRDLSDIEKDIEIDQLTVKAYEFKESLEDLGKISEESFQTMREAINSGIDDLDSIQEFSNLKEILSNLFDVQISDDEIRENFDLIQQLAQGNIGVLDQLQTKLSQDYIAKIAAQVDSPAVDSAVLELQNLIDLHPLEDLELGVSLDDAGYTEALQNLIVATGMSAEEANELLKRIGFEPEVTEQEIPFDEKHFGETDGQYTYSYTLPEDMGGGQRVINITQDQYAQAKAAGSITIPVIHGKKSKFTGGSKFGNFSSSPKSGSSGKGKGKGGGGGKGSQPKTPKKAAGVTTKTDPYRTVNNALKRTGSDLEKVRKEQDKLAGKDLIDNLTKQQKILDEQVELYKEKLAIAKQERDTIASTLQQQGIGLQFDQNGTISNMEQALGQAAAKANAEIARYNRMSAEQQEKDVNKNIAKNAETWFKNIQTLLSNYDKLTEDTIPKLEQDIQDQLEKQLELNLQKFNLQVDLTLDAGQAKRQYDQFKKDILDSFGEDNIRQNNQYLRTNIESYVDENQALEEHIRKIQERIRNMQAGQFDSVYGRDINKAISDLDKYTDSATKNLEDIKKDVEDLRDSIFDAIDQVTDKFEQQQKEFDYIGDVIEHGRKLTELMYGDDAFEQMDKFYEQERKNNNQQLEFQYGQTQIWYNKMLDAKDQLDKASNDREREYWEKQLKEYERLYLDCQKELNDTFEKSIENIIDKFVNAIETVFDKTQKAMTGGLGFDFINDEWDLINKNTDRYLDKVDALYEIDSLDQAYRDAIKNAEGNPKAQQALNNLMNTQLQYLRDKDKLTKYDVDRANALLNIEVKRLAIENARNNKSKLRLRRDSQGNYTYQYVADDSDVNKAEQDLAKARVDLFDMTRDSLKDSAADLIDNVTDMQSKYKEIMEDVTLDAEEKQRRLQMLGQQYGKTINDILSEVDTTSGFIAGDMLDSLSQSLHEIIALSDKETNDLLNAVVPQLGSSLFDAIKNISENGIDTYMNEWYDGYEKAHNQFEQDRQQAQAYSDQSLDYIVQTTQDLNAIADNLLRNNQELLNENRQFIDQINQQIAQVVQAAMSGVNESLAGTAGSALETSQNFLKASANIQEAIKQLNEAYYLANNEKASGEDVNNVNKSVQDVLSSGIATYATGGHTGAWGETGKLAVLHEKELVLNSEDTSRILSAVDIVRTIDGLLSNIDVNNQIMDGSIIPVAGAGSSTTTDQNVHIEAHFPNVSMHTQIEKAFENLVNQAYQYAYKR